MSAIATPLVHLGTEERDAADARRLASRKFSAGDLSTILQALGLEDAPQSDVISMHGSRVTTRRVRPATGDRLSSVETAALVAALEPCPRSQSEAWRSLHGVLISGRSPRKVDVAEAAACRIETGV